MRGKVSAIAPDGSYGQISAEDGQFYSYWTSEVRNGQARPGQSVEFRMWEGQPVEIFLLEAPRPPAAQPPQRTAVQQMANRAQAQDRMPAMPSSYAAAAAGSSGFPSAGYWLTLFTSPSGRISRRQFWLHGVVPLIAVSLVAGWIPILNFLIFLAILWAQICICFKRFHDRGLPGWWSLAGVVPMILALVILTASIFFGGLNWTVVSVLYGLGALITLAQLFLVYVRVGEPGPNSYGPDPLEAQ